MELPKYNGECLVEFKIYISLKHKNIILNNYLRLVEFKIYISLKRYNRCSFGTTSLVEFKIYISLKQVKEMARKKSV